MKTETSLKKNFNHFLQEATSKKSKDNSAKWNDPDLFSGSDEWVEKLVKGKVKLDNFKE